MFKSFQTIPLLLLLLLPPPAHAQALEGIVLVNAPIFLLPDANRIPLRVAAVGTRVRVVEEQPEGWLKVEFTDPQFGPRVGYVETKFVRVERPELRPMDLSIAKQAPPATAPEPGSVPHQRPAPGASTTSGFARGWIDVNFGLAIAGESRYRSVFEREQFRETARFTADYRAPAGAEFDFGGGVMLTRNFGIGISFAGTAHQDNAQLGITIPHPIFFNTHASDTSSTEDGLVRSEGSANIQLMFVADLSERLRVRVYTGPSFFRVQQDAVDDIIYEQEFLILSPVNSVQILRYETTEISFDDATGWGFHVGADINMFFTRVVGIGGFAKYSRGTADFFDPFSETESAFKTGGFQTGGGLRLRF
jgi:hypothetical protein